VTLAIDGLGITLGGATILVGIDLHVEDGETLAVLGPSGSGKSTLLRAVAGLVEPSAGTVSRNGEDLAGLAAHRRGFGVVFQAYALFEHLDVSGNVAYGLRMRDVPKAERRERVGEALSLVGLGGYGPRTIDTLSGGERQRVALARALVVEPEVLLLDEPLGAIDVALKDQLLGDLQGITTGRTAIYVTHDHDEALTIGDRVALMREGRVVAIDTPERLWTSPPDPWSARFLGHPNVYEMSPFADGPCLVPEQSVRPGADVTGPVIDRRFVGDGWQVTADVGVALRYRAASAPAIGESVSLTVEDVVDLEG
jgi:thiamine transport system ATP-binding protein